MLHSSGDVWLASRNLTPDSAMAAFGVLTVDIEGNLESNSFYVETSDSTLSSGYHSHGVRPVVKLKSHLNVNGKGTEEEPYVIIDDSK